MPTTLHFGLKCIYRCHIFKSLLLLITIIFITAVGACTYKVVVEVLAGQSTAIKRDVARRRLDGKSSVGGYRVSIDKEVVGHSSDVRPFDVATDDRRNVDFRLELKQSQYHRHHRQLQRQMCILPTNTSGVTAAMKKPGEPHVLSSFDIYLSEVTHFLKQQIGPSLRAGLSADCEQK